MERPMFEVRNMKRLELLDDVIIIDEYNKWHIEVDDEIHELGGESKKYLEKKIKELQGFLERKKEGIRFLDSLDI
jgi:hypothetical protein